MHRGRYYGPSGPGRNSRPPPGTDGYHVPAPTYVPQQQPNQSANQSQNLRNIAPPTGPPNQSSTPPNSELKVQAVAQQSMNHMYAPPQQQVRGNQGPYTYRSAAGPPSQQPRMPNQHRAQQQQLFTAPMQWQVPTQMYITAAPANQMQYFNGQRPPQVFQQPIQFSTATGQHIVTAAPYSYPSNPGQAPTLQPYSYYPGMIQRSNHPPQAATVASTPSQPIPAVQMPQQPAQQPPIYKQHRRRAKAIPVIDPDTGVDRLDEVFIEQQNSSHPPSGESSARQTPQPVPVPNNSKEVQAAFAKQVAQAISNDEPSSQQHQQQQHHHHQQQQPNSLLPPGGMLVDDVMGNDVAAAAAHHHGHVTAHVPSPSLVEQPPLPPPTHLHHPHHPHMVEPPSPYHPHPHHLHSGGTMAGGMPPSNTAPAVPSLHQQQQQQQQPPTSNRLDHIVQSSTLKAQAKEFVLSSSSSSSTSNTNANMLNNNSINMNINSSTATKETTPIVSANCDSVEVTLPNKQPMKDRESPAKSSRKQQKDSSTSSSSSIPQQQQQPQPIPSKESQQPQAQPISDSSSSISVSSSSSSSIKESSKISSSSSRESPATVAPPSAPQSQQQQQPAAVASVTFTTTTGPKEGSTNSSTGSIGGVNANVQTANKDVVVVAAASTTTAAATTTKEVEIGGGGKKGHHGKKETVKTSAVAEATNADRTEVASSQQQTPAAQETLTTSAPSVNAKSKNAGQRSKDHSKHQQQQQQQNNNAVQSAANNNQQQKQQNVVVPPPQPAKAHNKTSKKSDINQRGANKEGTDMDAFNDNSAAAAVTAANVNNVSGSGDVKLNVKQQQQQQRDLDNVQITNVVAAKNNNNLNNSSSGAVVVNNHDLLNANSLPATTTTTTVNAKNDATETTTVAPSSAELINDVANKNTTPAATIAVAKPASINDVITSTTTTPPPSTAPTATPLPPSRREVTPPPAPQTTTVVPPKVTSSLPSKGSFDITDIVREKPKPIKSYPQPPPPQQHTSSSPGESQDETDRMAVSAQSVTDRLAPPTGKEGEGAAANKTAKPDLPYTKTQWAPFNQEGVKVYERDFLLALRDNPLSREKPPNLPDMIIAGDDRGRLSDGRYSMGGRTDFTNPPFLGYGGKSSSQRGPPPKRNSQSKAGPSGGGGGGGGGGKGSKSQMIKVSISVREDVKLHETENAWKPARFVKSETMTDEDTKTAELYRKVRGVLNKLTPQKFQTLVEKVRALDIDTLDRLQGVIDLVFEKAVDEPNFSVAYALMCRELAMMHVQGDKSDQSPEEQAHASNVNFRKLLITRCQMEFEKNSVDEKARNQRRKEIEQCEDPDKRKEMQEELDEEDRKIRVKSVGNIRFIGELFKQNMLTVNIMLRCLTNLIDAKDEESLECLCKLLTTIGKEMETKNVNLGDIFNTMRDIVERKHGKVSSRVRFMLQDVIDLRKSKWVPRRQESKPKTMEQIQKEAENEHFNIQVMNATPIQQRPRDDRSGSAGPGSDRRRPKNMQDDGGWQTQAPRNNRQQQQFNVQSEKLKFKPIQIDEPLGSSQMFGSWSKGSIMTKTAPSLAPANTANMYAALENIDMDKRPSGKHYSGSMNNNNNKEPYSSKGPSLERGTYKQYNDGRGSRSGSQHRTNSPAPMQQQKMGPPPSSSFGGRDAKFGGGAPSQSGGRSGNVAMAQQAAAPPAEVQATTATAQAEGAAVTALSGEALHRRLENNLDEYLNESCSVAEYDQDTKSCVPAEEMYNVVYEGYMHVLERSSAARIRTGMLFAQVVQKGTIPLADYCKGLKEVLDQADDLIIDIPKIWDYLAEILVHMICEGALPLRSLHKCASKLIGEGHGAHMLASLFRLVVNEKGPNFLANIWQASGLALTDFMRADQTAKFIEEHKLEFLCGGDTPSGQSQLTHEQMEHKLLEFFRQEASFDDVVNWITANVGEKVKEDKFIRCLATAIFKNSIQSNTRLRESTLQSHYNMLHKYVGNKNQELQCLFALQALINKLEHPQGLLLATCERLYDDATFSLESFIAWEENDDPAEQEGKGVALKQLTSFFTQLKENDDEEEEYGSSEADET